MPDVFPFGLFIKRIEQTKTSDESGGENIFTVELTDHSRRHFVVKNGHTGSACEGINEIRASVDNSVGTPSVEVVETDAGAKKDINFIFKNLKGNPGNFELTEEVKQYIKDRLAEVRMPFNPVCAYDMADVQYTDVTQNDLKNFSYTFSTGGNYAIYNETAVNALKNGCRYRITADFEILQGDTKHAFLCYYDFDGGGQWGESLYDSLTPVVNGRCTCVLDFVCKTTELPGHRLRVLFYNGQNGNILPNAISKWSNFRIETISDTQAIDSSGNGNHAIVADDVFKIVDNDVGAALTFNKGFLARPTQDFIGVGKRWSHSRWIKIDRAKQDKNTNPWLWQYGNYDYGFCEIKNNNGVMGNFYISMWSNGVSMPVSIPKEKIFNNQWHHLVVCTDLQKTHVRRIVYIDNIKIADVKKDGDFSNFVHIARYYDMKADGDDCFIGSLANLIFFDRFLTKAELQWLYLNPYYPAKRYSLEEYKADEILKMIESLKKG